MAMTAMRVDERERAALARLTANEKECLRRRLLPQTAKEMALDLRISPHAVEKRLKMARAKLGVSSSLAAARLLVAAEEGYGSVGAQPAALSAFPAAEQEDDTVSPMPRQLILPAILASGAALMILASLLALLSQSAPTPASTVTTIFDSAGRPVAARRTDIDEAAAFNGEHFDQMDTDQSGFLDPREASAMEPRDRFREKSLPPAPPASERDPAGERKWMAKLDTDHDGRVSREEYITYMMPWTLLSGVPNVWRGAKADADARARATADRH